MAYEAHDPSRVNNDQFWEMMSQVPLPADVEVPEDPFILPNNRILIHITSASLDILEDRIRNYQESLTTAVNNLTYVGLAVSRLGILQMAYRSVADAEKIDWKLPHHDLPAVDESTIPTAPNTPKKINVAVADGRLAEFALFETVHGCNKEVAVNALMDFGDRTYKAMRDEAFYIAVQDHEGIGVITHPDHRDTLVLPHPDHFLD